MIEKALDHLRLGPSVGRWLAALQASEHGRGDIELNRQIALRNGLKDAVELAQERGVVDRFDQCLLAFDHEQPEH